MSPRLFKILQTMANDLHSDCTPIPYISLFSGYEGIGLGLEAAGLNLLPIAYCEREGMACHNLVQKIEEGELGAAPIFTDVRTFPGLEFAPYMAEGILTAGYPCQDFSAAGGRAGRAGAKGKLWDDVRRIVSECRPGICFFENVEGHITLGLEDVVRDLGRLGYVTTWGIFSAAEVGASHSRKRVFILAHSQSDGSSRIIRKLYQQNEAQWQSQECGEDPTSESEHADRHGREKVADTTRLHGNRSHGQDGGRGRVRESSEELEHPDGQRGAQQAGCRPSDEENEWAGDAGALAKSQQAGLQGDISDTGAKRRTEAWRSFARRGEYRWPAEPLCVQHRWEHARVT